jgi:hypothetical protein
MHLRVSQPENLNGHIDTRQSTASFTCVRAPALACPDRQRIKISLLVCKSSQFGRTFLEARLDGCQESAIALPLDVAQNVCVKHDSELGNLPRIGTYLSNDLHQLYIPRFLPVTLISLPDLTTFSALLTMLLELYQPPPSKLDTYYILSEIA